MYGNEDVSGRGMVIQIIEPPFIFYTVNHEADNSRRKGKWSSGVFVVDLFLNPEYSGLPRLSARRLSVTLAARRLGSFKVRGALTLCLRSESKRCER